MISVISQSIKNSTSRADIIYNVITKCSDILLLRIYGIVQVSYSIHSSISLSKHLFQSRAWTTMWDRWVRLNS